MPTSRPVHIARAPTRGGEGAADREFRAPSPQPSPPSARLRASSTRYWGEGVRRARTSIGDIPLGILFMVLATMLFAISSAVAKWQVARYPVGEVMFVRSFASLIACAAVVLPLTGLSVFATRRAGAHIARGLSQSISQTFTVIAFGLMPLAGAIAINFSAPIWAALLSILWLRERAGPARLAALAVGFLGVLIVAKPGTDSLQLGALFALGNAIMYGSVTVAVRGMSATESPNTLLLWQMVTIALFHSILLAFGFRWPSGLDGAMLVGSGVANAIGQYAWTRALHLAPTAAVSPFYYLMLVWAVLIGFLVWGDIPSASLLAGSAIVVASGLSLLWYEAQRRRSDRYAASGRCVHSAKTVGTLSIGTGRPKR